MTRAALFLITRGLKNRLMRWLMRLRQPRYLAGAALAGLYLYTFLFRRHVSIAAAPASRVVGTEFFSLMFTFLALAILVGAWAMPSESPSFVFSEAEIQFLFPAPVSRRQLLGYKLLQSQVGLLFTSAILSVFAFRGSHYVGMWLAIAVINIYTMFVSFARARLKLVGIGLLTRLAAVLAVTIAILSLAAWQLRASAPAALEAVTTQNMKAFGKLITDAASHPPLGYVLAVPRVFGEVVYAPSSELLVRNIAILIVLGALFFFAAVKLDVAFEDASIVASQRSLARRARMRGMRGGGATAVRQFPPLFRLADRGRPEIAVLWKNLIAAMRISSFPLIALIFPIAFVAAASIFRNAEAATSLGISGLIVTGIFVFAGPQMVRSDLRLDLLRLDLIKAFPLTAESLLIAELAAPLLILSAFELLMLTISLVILNFSSVPSFVTSPEFIVCAIVLIVPVTAIQLLIQNGAMILFPAWSLNTDTTMRGLTALGQRMLFFIGNFVTLAISLLPAAAVLAGTMFVVTKFFGRSPAMIVLSTIPAAAILAGEAAIAHRFLAAQFDEIDIANDVENATP